jgi:hypothetical protein
VNAESRLKSGSGWTVVEEELQGHYDTRNRSVAEIAEAFNAEIIDDPGESLPKQARFALVWNRSLPEAPDLPIESRRAGSPYARGRPTSHGAALGDRSRMRAQLLKAIRRHGPLTDEEITGLLNCRDSNSVRPRRLELSRAGLIEDAGRRQTKSSRAATAWRAV